MQGAWVLSLVRELRSCMPYGATKKQNKTPEYFLNHFLINKKKKEEKFCMYCWHCYEKFPKIYKWKKNKSRFVCTLSTFLKNRKKKGTYLYLLVFSFLRKMAEGYIRNEQKWWPREQGMKEGETESKS